MVDEHGYTGPPVGVDAKARLKARAASFVRRRADQIHHEDVMAWAAADTGDYPSLRDAAQEALEELELLLRGIGRWGLVDPNALPNALPSGRRPRPRPWFGTPDWDSFD